MWNSAAGVAVADQARPERHHLHVAARAGDADRVLAKAALDLDQAEHAAPARGRRACSRTRASAGTRRASTSSVLLLAQPLAHRAEPAQVGEARVDVVEARARRRRCRRSPQLSAVRTASASGSSTCAPACARRGQRDAARRGPPPRRARRRALPRRESSPVMRRACPSGRQATSAAGTLGRRGIAAALVLELAFLQAAVGDDDAVRHADQLPVGEHRAGALAAVVEDARRRRRRRARRAARRRRPCTVGDCGRSRSGRRRP